MLDLTKKLIKTSDKDLYKTILAVSKKDARIYNFIEKYTASTRSLDLPKYPEMRSVLMKIFSTASDALRTAEIEPYELALLKNKLLSVIDIWFESIFHKKRFEKLLVLSGLIVTYNFDPFNDLILFPGLEEEVNLRIKRFLETLSSPERRDFFHMIFDLIETELYPQDKGGPAVFLTKALGQLECSNAVFDLDLLKFYDEYFDEIKDNMILSNDLTYLPLFIHYCDLIKTYRIRSDYQKIIIKSRFLREIILSHPTFTYDPQEWEIEHLKKLLSYPLFKKICLQEKDFRDSIINFDQYVKEHDLDDTFYTGKGKN